MPFGLIKHAYLQNSRIKHLTNSAKSFSIEKSYINLTVVDAKEQQEKEKKLPDAHHNGESSSAYEDIYGTKTMIDVNDLFQKCEDYSKQVLVLGRPGIGKSTFCQYITYQWAKGALWQQYDLVVLIPLRHLTENRYPPSLERHYSLIDLIKKEYFDQGLSETDEILLEKHSDTKQILWLLDGYDEIAQNMPTHLQYLFEEQLLKTPHHILTSRPYNNTLTYNITVEIIGFTGDNIAQYVEQFFYQIKDEVEDSLARVQSLWSFLKQTPIIWDIVHIPVNLELICNLWTGTDWSETKSLTITTLYDNIITWLYRRHLTKQGMNSTDKCRKKIYELYRMETRFLETLAFHATVNGIVLLPPKLLEKAENETSCSLDDHPEVLNIGILTSHHRVPIGGEIEVERDHYFVHLSFQDYYAARYLVTMLSGPTYQKAIDFIKSHKYYPRFALTLTFASGILVDSNLEQCLDMFWDTLLGFPVDLIGLRHIQLLISCLEEAGHISSVRRRAEVVDSIVEWMKIGVLTKDWVIHKQIRASLQRSVSLTQEATLQDTLITLSESTDPSTKKNLCSLLSQIQISNPSSEIIHLLITELGNEDENVRRYAQEALTKMRRTTATNEVISNLLPTLHDEDWHVRYSACQILGEMSEKAVTSEVIDGLVEATGNEDWRVKHRVCEALKKMCNTKEANSVINRLITALSDERANIRAGACEALGFLGKEAETSEVINGLQIAVADRHWSVRESACEALIQMGEVAATDEVINRLVIALGDENKDVRRKACRALGNMGEKAATNVVINGLVTALSDQEWSVESSAREVLKAMAKEIGNNDVVNGLVSALSKKNHNNGRKSACLLLRDIGEKAAINEMISELVIVLHDEDDNIRKVACETVAKMGDKVVTKEMITGLVTALGDPNDDVKKSVCDILGNLGEKAATNDVINGLGIALLDANIDVGLSACAALWKMGVTAGTSTVFNRLMVAFMGQDACGSFSAAYSFLTMCHKASTNDLIDQLEIALSDENDDVRAGAWQALCYVDGEVMNNSVINRLISALSDDKLNIKLRALQVFINKSEKVATIEVINGLVIALHDEHEDVRLNACRALGNMGERAPINEMISSLLTTLGSMDETVKKNAHEVIKNMGDKLATDEMLNALATSLANDSDDIKQSVCEVLDKMGEKAATSNVINGLVLAVSNKNKQVRKKAWEALKSMGEKAATSELIVELEKALLCDDYGVSHCAWDVLKKIGTKAATNNVINILVTQLREEYSFYRTDALEVAEVISEKTATNDLVDALLDVLLEDTDHRRYSDLHLQLHQFKINLMATEALQKSLVSLSLLTKMNSDVVSKLGSYIHRDPSLNLKTIPPEQFLRAFLNTKNPVWLPIVTIIALRQGSAITLSENTITVYGSKERVEIPIFDQELRGQLIEAFNNQRTCLRASN